MELLRVESLTKHFPVRRGFGHSGQVLRAVDGVSFTVGEEGALALVGESGCGKSTVARLMLGLMPPTSGSVRFRGEEVFGLGSAGLKAFRKSVQIIFQDPFASLNPRRTVFDTVSEPLVVHGMEPRRRLRDASVEILSKVGLGPDALMRYPHEFSGGQRQRICIARALAVSPELIVADEPLSALDVSIQAQIINLLVELRKQNRIAFLFISHDLRVVHYLSDEVCVMYLGRIVEYAKTEELFAGPLHPYTEMLLASAPEIAAGKDRSARHRPASGEAPSPLNIPSGCPFHPRCPKRFGPCDKIMPDLLGTSGRLVACHLVNTA